MSAGASPPPDPRFHDRVWAPGRDADLGVVVPALDEAESLPDLLADLSELRTAHQVVVVDGGSRDATAAAARAGGAWVTRSRRGRARQFNAGAAFLESRWLLFLHADTRLGGKALRAVERHVAENRPHAAHFGLALAHRHPFYRLIEFGQRVRERCLGLVYGDQGLLIRRDLFWDAGGYPDQPLMEDVVLNRRLASAGRLARLPARARTSARRYEEEGRLRAFLRNASLISRFLAGADPAVLARRYPARRHAASDNPEAAELDVLDPGATAEARRHAGSGNRHAAELDLRDGGATAEACRQAGDGNQAAPGPPTPATLLIFAKTPRPGHVKTRLARAWGAAAAAQIYRRLGRQVVSQLAGAPAQTVLCFDPPGSEDEIRAWLGGQGVRAFVPQGDGDLGERMSRATTAAFAQGAQAVVVTGTDAPAVGAETVARALDALRCADVVIGPSSDGGYYLIGLVAPQPALFADMPWSTERVFRETTSRCAALGLRVTCLPVESDIDRPEDVPPELAARLMSSTRTS